VEAGFERTVRRLNALSLLAVGMLAGAGCRSVDEPASASFASVTITNRTSEQIRDTVTDVFRENGYVAASTGKPGLVFEKEGSRSDQIAYGNWMGGPSVWVRVKADVVPLAPGSFRLQCSAYMLRDRNDAFFEEEIRLSRLHNGPYQKLLEETQRRLETSP
jgi:hypothetical protein